MANLSPPFRLTGVKAVAFDLDDTLFDRRAAFHHLLEHWLGRNETTLALPEILAHDHDGRTSRPRFFAWLRARFPSIPSDIQRKFHRDFPAHIQPDPSALELLTALQRAAIPVALLSNGSAAFQMAKLRASGAAPFFRKSHLLFSSTLGFAKPDPRAFSAIAALLDHRAEEILFIGDDPLRDIAGASEAGFQTCRLQRPGRAVSQTLAVASLADLIPLLIPPP